MNKSVVTAAELKQRVVESEETLERLRAERDQLDSAIEGWEQRYEQRKEAAARLGAAELGLKRSAMTPLAKSKYIREHGGQAYLDLPWK